MQASKIIHTVSCLAEGEVGDVIVGGVAHFKVTLFGSKPAGLLKTKVCEILCLTNPVVGYSGM